jgi:hypothetical protein
MLNMRQCRCLAGTYSRADLQAGNDQMGVQGTCKNLRAAFLPPRPVRLQQSFA